MTCALVIGGGPAGLMAAQALLDAGHRVVLADAKPSLGRKLLMAGKSGLNLTKQEPLDRFLSAYGDAPPLLRRIITAFPPAQQRAWADDLGAGTFVGSSGRVFPTAMKASPLLRAWLARLTQAGLVTHTRWRWTGWQGNTCLFDTPDGPRSVTPQVTVFALGGASWARLGSDGKWAKAFENTQIPLTSFAASNVGITVDWSPHMADQFGAPIKNVTLYAGAMSNRGEIVLTQSGIEGGGLYPLSPALRQMAALTLDLFPDLDAATLANRLSRPRGKTSWSGHLRKTLKLDKTRLALINEVLRPLPTDPAVLAARLKALPLPYTGLRPMDEAISTVGGVTFGAVDDTLMLRTRPGTFCAGEMLDWDAPTGGYLLTACLASGQWAGRHAALYVNKSENAG